MIWLRDLKEQLERVEASQKRIENKLDLLIKGEAMENETLDQLLADVQSESTVDDSIIALVGSIQSQLAAALANTTIAPADQDKINAIFSAVEANKAKISAAVTANTPTAPASA